MRVQDDLGPGVNEIPRGNSLAQNFAEGSGSWYVHKRGLTNSVRYNSYLYDTISRSVLEKGRINQRKYTVMDHAVCWPCPDLCDTTGSSVLKNCRRELDVTRSCPHPNHGLGIAHDQIVCARKPARDRPSDVNRYCV